MHLEIPPLDFDLDTVAGLVGTASGDTEVTITFGLVDGRVLVTHVTTDARGRFAFGPADVPAGEDWSLADIETVRVEHVFAGYHRVVRDMADQESPVPPPARVYVVYLPWLGAPPDGGTGLSATANLSIGARRHR